MTICATHMQCRIAPYCGVHCVRTVTEKLTSSTFDGEPSARGDTSAIGTTRRPT